ncbi:mechanosensitive ion channel [Myxococcota bacterium]|nr:mechanosensitive ion channel [Myxococcota bacterium]MBU1431944.1 mechanosensitive ion channel [Myxococcota bacterium]MBU1898911.1 mechanosensitive ion channel [Myxococcota bacterium]
MRSLVPLRSLACILAALCLNSPQPAHAEPPSISLAQIWPLDAGMLPTPAASLPTSDQVQPPTPKPVEPPLALSPHALLLRERDTLKARKLEVEGQDALKVYEEAVSLSDKALDLEQQAARIAAEAELPPPPKPTPLPPAPNLEAIQDLNAAAVEQRQRAVEIELINAREQLAALKEKLEAQRDAPKGLRDQITERRARVATLKDKPPTPDGAASDMAAAQRALSAAQLRLHRAEILFFEQRLLFQAPLLSHLIAAREALTLRVEGLERQLKGWKAHLTRKREQEAKAAAEEAKAAHRQIARQAPAVRDLSKENVRLSQDLEAATKRLSQLNEEEVSVTRRLSALEREVERVSKRLNGGALSETTARLLRRRQREMPSRRALKRGVARWRAEVAAAQSALLDIIEREEDISPQQRVIRVYLSRALAQTKSTPTLGGMLDDLFRDQVEVIIRQLLEDRQALLKKLSLAYEEHIAALSRLDALELRQEARFNGYRDLLDERLLWIPSTARLSLDDFIHAADDVDLLARVIQRAPWGLAGLARCPLEWRLGTLAALLVALLGFVRRLRLRKRLTPLPATPRRRLLQISGALGLPAAVALIGGCLSRHSEGDSAAIGYGLLGVGAFWLTTRGVRALVAGNEVPWQATIRASLNRETRWLEWALIPSIFVLMTLERYGQPQDGRALQRMALIYTLTLAALFTLRLLREGGLSGPLMARYPDAWLVRLRFVWYPLAVLTPLTLAVLATLGYTDSAYQLAHQLMITSWMVMALALAEAGFSLWLERLEPPPSALAIPDGRGYHFAKGSALKMEDDAEAAHAARLQVIRALIGTLGIIGLWTIWARVLPALGIFEEVVLWTYNATVDGAEVQTPITLGRFAQAILTFVFTVLAAKVLPTLMELIVLLRLPFTGGTRHAITQVSRYLIFAVGLIISLKALGLEWGRVQWLVAALSVGLGFGLQEIVANFVSGLIILIERPFRVGDILTVGDIKGVVSRLQIRATTIIGFDRRELVVPNKEFITGPLINWSLSDSVSRLTIPVGIAYGSDTDRAHALLLEIARAHPLVLERPSPMAFFLSFGASSLDFELRVFIGDVLSTSQVSHDLHTRINQAFGEAGIVIAFPQQDVHLDASAPLPVQIVQPERTGEPIPSAPSLKKNKKK